MNDKSVFQNGASPHLTRRELLLSGAAAGAVVGITRLAGGQFAAAQATPATPDLEAAEEYLANPGDFVEAANWDEQQVVVVELNEFAFTPSDLTFGAGMPYELIIRNAGKEKHYFTAHSFFRSIATRKVENPQSEVKVPYFTAIEVLPGMEVELYFVPVMAGTYDLFCEIEGHADAGMRGTITVTGETLSEPVPTLATVAEGEWVQDATDRVKAADWDAMETVSIELGEFFFKPNEITLEVDLPYKLDLTNGGTVKHEFTADAFYASVALRKVEDASGEYKAPRLVELEVFAGQQAALYLIPTVVGEYELICEIKGHKEEGMFGTITVVKGN